MIQRKQTLFFIQSIFLSLALLFIPSVKLLLGDKEISLSMVAYEGTDVQTGGGHSAAVAINFIILALVSLTVFLFKRRELQIKLTYVGMLLWLVLAAMILFCPFTSTTDAIQSHVQVIAPIICVVGITALFFAQRFIKKDIDLLKSADRIR